MYPHVTTLGTASSTSADEAVRAWERAGREARKADAAAVKKALEG